MTDVMTRVMTPVMTFATGRQLWLSLHRAGVQLVATNERLRFDAPAGAITEPIKLAMKERKAELLAITTGDYLAAAMYLVRTGLMPDRERERRVAAFDQFVAERKAAGVDCNAAHREAYMLLARDIEAAYVPDEYDRAEREAIRSEAA